MPLWCWRWRAFCCKKVIKIWRQWHRCRHTVHLCRTSVTNWIYRQYRWHRRARAKWIIITPPVSSIWIHSRICCERFGSHLSKHTHYLYRFLFAGARYVGPAPRNQFKYFFYVFRVGRNWFRWMHDRFNGPSEINCPFDGEQCARKKNWNQLVSVKMDGDLSLPFTRSCDDDDETIVSRDERANK